MKLQAPYQYFGGKSRVASIVWDRLGDVANYVEPFYGSGAVLLARPVSHTGHIETVNDLDAHIANFWRAVQAEPDAVADELNWPVNEVDLISRHRWLCRMPEKTEFAARMKADPELYDVRRAAWWCWGLCQWIGHGWCEGEWYGDSEPDNCGRGVCNGAGKLPQLGRSQGVHKQLPQLGDAGVGECGRRREVLRQWMQALADRLRNVRVCCGDWLRVCGSETTTTRHGVTGVFLDPPYSGEAGRANAIYASEDLAVAHDVRRWCLERGDDRKMRIILCGYEGEGHEELERAGWHVQKWKAHGGYSRLGKGDTAGKSNRHRERLWFSPNCIQPTDAGWLF